jgi:hypothetical protein
MSEVRSIMPCMHCSCYLGFVNLLTPKETVKEP